MEWLSWGSDAVLPPLFKEAWLLPLVSPSEAPPPLRLLAQHHGGTQLALERRLLAEPGLLVRLVEAVDADRGKKQALASVLKAAVTLFCWHGKELEFLEVMEGVGESFVVVVTRKCSRLL